MLTELVRDSVPDVPGEPIRVVLTVGGGAAIEAFEAALLLGDAEEFLPFGGDRLGGVLVKRGLPREPRQAVVGIAVLEEDGCITVLPGDSVRPGETGLGAEMAVDTCTGACGWC